MMGDSIVTSTQPETVRQSFRPVEFEVTATTGLVTGNSGFDQSFFGLDVLFHRREPE